MVHLSQLLYQCWYFVVSKTHVFQFPWCSFSFPRFFPGCQLTINSHVSVGPLGCDCSLQNIQSWGLPDAFLMARLVDGFLRGRSERESTVFTTYLSAWLTSGVYLDPLAAVKYSSSFSTVKLLFPLSFLLLLSRRKLLYTAPSYASLP